jgi:hypothetical protein
MHGGLVIVFEGNHLKGVCELHWVKGGFNVVKTVGAASKHL